MIYPDRRVQFVIKVSKFCNLRCRYCYELEDLGDRERMSLDGLERMYRHIADWYDGLDHPATVDFVWHGGEPLLVPPEYYDATFESQRGILGDRVGVRNVIQTNLTVLDRRRLDLLAKFDDVGVSVDLYGELRTDVRGRDSVRRVLRNMDRLRAEGIDFGCITVVTSANVAEIRRIIRFYDAYGVNSVRLLPLFDGAFDDQHAGYDITPEEVLSAYQDAFEELLDLDSALRVEPLSSYALQVVHHHTPGGVPNRYDKRSWEPVYVVDTNGDLYSYADEYDPAFCYGNIFHSPLERINRSIGRLESIQLAEGRLADVCDQCRWFGSCDGYPIAEEAARQTRKAESATCVIDRRMHDYIEERLRELGALDCVVGEAPPREPVVAFQRRPQLPLSRDVRIRFIGECSSDRDDRVALSTGTTGQARTPSDGLRYLSAAIVPRAPFRRPTASELDLLLEPGEAPWELGTDVGVVRIPDEVIAPLEKLFDDHGTRDRLDQYRTHTDHPQWDRAYSVLSNYIAETFAGSTDEPRLVRLASALPEMTTVTKDSFEGEGVHRYVGLHVDSWLKAPLEERSHVQNRICVNLGREERYFLLMNLTLARMNDALHGDELKSDRYYGSDLGHDFMSAFPDYPVVRLTIKPREAYIAPTENLIHDATSLGKAYPDLAMHMIGYFGVPGGSTAGV